MTQFRGVYARWRRKSERFARRHGFFWLPCQLCGEPYGGQEPSGALLTQTGNGETWRGICGYCTAERQQAAERRLWELGETLTTGHGSSSDGRAIPVHRIPFEFALASPRKDSDRG